MWTKLMWTAQNEYRKSYDSIHEAIAKTGLAEDMPSPSFTEYLNVLDDGIIVAALRYTSKIEELDGTLAAFNEYIATQKKDILEHQLTEISPLLARFFGDLDHAVSRAYKILEFTDNLTQTQQLAIEEAEKNQKLLIKYESKREHDDFDAKCHADWEKTIAKIGHGSRWSCQFDKLRMEHSALVTAAVVQLHAVNDLEDRFIAIKHPGTKKIALTLAKDIQNCVVKMLQTQATIRASVLMARQMIIASKPEVLDPKAASLWESINKCVTNLSNNYIQMVKISEIYFSFFVKFKSGFEHYWSCRERRNNLGRDFLIVATEYVQRDVNYLTTFKQKLRATVDALEDASKELMDQFGGGSMQFGSRVLSTREVAKNKILDLLPEFHKNSKAIDLSLGGTMDVGHGNSHFEWRISNLHNVMQGFKMKHK
eukprot:800583_1